MFVFPPTHLSPPAEQYKARTDLARATQAGEGYSAQNFIARQLGYDSLEALQAASAAEEQANLTEAERNAKQEKKQALERLRLAEEAELRGQQEQEARNQLSTDLSVHTAHLARLKGMRSTLESDEHKAREAIVAQLANPMRDMDPQAGAYMDYLVHTVSKCVLLKSSLPRAISDSETKIKYLSSRLKEIK